MFVEKAYEGLATPSVSVRCVVYKCVLKRHMRGFCHPKCEVNIEKNPAGAAVRGSESVGART